VLSALQQGYLLLACGFGYAVLCIQINFLGATSGVSVLHCVGSLTLCLGMWVTQRGVESSLKVVISKLNINAMFWKEGGGGMGSDFVSTHINGNTITRILSSFFIAAL